MHTFDSLTRLNSFMLGIILNDNKDLLAIFVQVIHVRLCFFHAINLWGIYYGNE